MKLIKKNLLSNPLQECVLVLFLFMLINVGFSQLQIEKTTIDFGNVTNDTERYQDIRIKNIGTKKEYILNYKAPKEVTCLFNTQVALQDSTLIFRIQPNPKKTGFFSYEIILYTSDKIEPTLLHIKGNLQEYVEDPLAKLQACPTFKDKPSAHATDFKLTIITKDKTTENLLSDVTVSLFQNGLEIQRLHTNQNGKVSKEVPLGFIYFYASKKGYLPIEMGSYVNLKTNEITLSLSKDSTKQNIENKYIINENILV
jgi:hypothetical protein